SSLNTASRHQKQPPPRVAISSLIGFPPTGPCHTITAAGAARPAPPAVTATAWRRPYVPPGARSLHTAGRKRGCGEGRPASPHACHRQQWRSVDPVGRSILAFDG